MAPNTNEGRNVSVDRTFLSLKAGMLCACNSLHASIDNDVPVTGFPVCFLIGEVRLHLSGLFTSDVVPDMLKAKDYQCIGMVFHLIYR